tara:strand:- start:13361 stop:14452 length:1092 start_codon:yes stop_codon:yes gene_type:complete
MGGLNFEQIEDALAERGLSIPKSRLRSWREDGLLPAAEKGGLTRYSETTIEQVIAVNRLYKRKRSRELVGWNLWLEGYETPESYWRPHFEKAVKTQFRGSRWIVRRFISWREDTLERLHSTEKSSKYQSLVPSPFRTRTKNLSPETLVERIAFLAETIGGKDEFVDAETVERQVEGLATLAGMSRRHQHVISGEQISVQVPLQNYLDSLASVMDAKLDASMFRGSRLNELQDARDYFTSGMTVAANLYDALSWIYGKYALGFHLVNWFRFQASPELQASIICLTMLVFKKDRSAYLGIESVREMSVNSEWVKNQSFMVQRLGKTHAEYAELLSKKSLKAALKSEEKVNELAHKIRQVRDSLLI